MTSRTDLEDFVLRPMQQAAPLTAKGEALAQELLDRVLPTGTGKTETDPRKIAQFILGGNFAVLLDGCPEAVLCEMQGFSRRGVEQPVTETVIMGPHQAFNENMRTNLSLLRRILKTPDLVDELFYVGKKAQNPLAICYMESIANPALVEEVKRRVQGIESDVVYTSGELAQLIEDKTFALLPQLLLTERPDRAASFLMDGMVLLVYDNPPRWPPFSIPARIPPCAGNTACLSASSARSAGWWRCFCPRCTTPFCSITRSCCRPSC